MDHAGTGISGGRLPLHAAAACGAESVVERLLASGGQVMADTQLTTPDLDGALPAHVAEATLAHAERMAMRLELPQVGRYMPDQFYRAHYDAFDLSTPDGKRFSQNGGQRVGTVLVYLNDVAEGGHTSFAKLGLSVQPVKGDAIVFFPATLDGKLDDLAELSEERSADAADGITH